MIIVLCQNPEPEFRGDKQENYLKNTNYITFFFKGKLAIHSVRKSIKMSHLNFPKNFPKNFRFKNDLSVITV